MSLFSAREGLYELELCQYGVTYCDDSLDGDRLIIAPKLQRRPHLTDSIVRYGSTLEMLEYLRIRDELIGVSYSHLAGMFIYYVNGYVPDEIPIHYVSELFLLGIDDPEDTWNISEEAYAAAHSVCRAAYDLVADMPPLPTVVVERMRAYVAETYHKNLLH